MPRSISKRRVGKNAPADLESALHDLGLRIYRSDDLEVTCYCPEHEARLGKEDRHPSWSVNRLTGLHNCYSCGFSGTFLGLVTSTLYGGKDVFAAARWIRQYGIDLDAARELPAWEDRVLEDAPRVAEMDEARLAFFVDPPQDELDKRFLTLEATRHYGILWDAENGAWILPIRAPGGDLLGWQYKSKRVFRNRPNGVPKSSTLFGINEFPIGAPAVLLESPLDVARLFCAGFEGGVAAYGVGVSDAQLRLLSEVTDELVVALDDDEDGRKHCEILRVGEWEGRRCVRQAWARQFNMRFFEYGDTGAKDIGAMEDSSDIEYGLFNAKHSTIARFGELSVRRPAAGLPARSSREDARPRPGAARVPAGRRKDPGDAVRARGAARRVR